MANGVILCPICDKDDQLEQVSQSNLRKLITLPEEPALEMPCLARITIASFWIFIILLGIFAVVGFLSIPSLQPQDLELYTGNLAISVIAIFLMGGFALGIRDVRKRVKKQQGKPAISKPAIPRNVEIYICNRDNIVFDPATGEFDDQANLQSFISGLA